MSKLDVLLINPGNRTMVYQQLGKELSAIEPPTFTLLVARYLQKRGMSVRVIDQPALDGSASDPLNIARVVEDYDPVLVGVFVYGYQPSASTQNMPAARAICEAIKGLNPKRYILMSGTHPAALPVQTLQEEPVDFVCDREGFVTTELLAKCIKAYGNDKDKLAVRVSEEVPDLWFWHSGGTLGLNELRTFNGHLFTTAQLDNLVDRPAWELVEVNGKLDHYRCHNWHAFDNMNQRSPYASIYSTLGCPFKCSFCCINAPFGNMLSGPRPYRFWSPEVVIKQIDILVKKYGVRQIKFVDEMFVLNEKHVFGITDLLTQRGYDLNIWAYARVDQTQDKFLDRLKKAGINWLALGIESGSEHVRDGANKIYSNNDITDVVKRIENAGIWTIGNYIFGLPDDDMDSMKATFDLATELNCEFGNFYSAMTYPGSPLYFQAVQAWLDDHWLDWESYSQHAYKTRPLGNERVSGAEVLRFRDEKHMEYFGSSKYQTMLLRKFGQSAVDSVNHMLSLGKPWRELLDQ